MSAFADFPSTTRHLGLPLLFVGQSQKEFFVNQSLAVIDGLLQKTINGADTSPPTDNEEGDCYLVLSPAEDAWEGRENQLALFIGGAWQFITPLAGTMVFDRSLGQRRCFDEAWQSVNLPEQATGGAVVDAEARALLAQVIDALTKLRLVATHPA